MPVGGNTRLFLPVTGTARKVLWRGLPDPQRGVGWKRPLYYGAARWLFRLSIIWTISSPKWQF